MDILFTYIILLIYYLEGFNEYEFNLISKQNEVHYKRLIKIFEWIRFISYLIGIYGIYHFLSEM
jgi:hypothetical protein